MVKGIAILVVVWAALLLTAEAGQPEEKPVWNSIKASLICETSPDHPTHLQVYLRLIDYGGGTTRWLADPDSGVKAELLGPDRKAVAEAPGTRTLTLLSSPTELVLPGDSRLDLLISHDWMINDPAGGYVLSIGSHLWFIPQDKISSYELHVRFPGVFPVPVKDSPEELRKPRLLFEVPPRKIVISTTSQ